MKPEPALAGRTDTHRWGLLLTVSGVLALVPDGTLVRAIEADTITTVMWRNGLIAVTVTIVLIIRNGFSPIRLVRRTGRAGLLSALLWGSTTSLFVASIDATSVGNTVLILAVSPLWAAIFSRWFIGEPVARRTLVALPFAVAGVALAFQSSIGTGDTTGDFFALAASLALAGNLTVLRRNSDVDFVPAAALGAWLVFVVTALLGGSFTLSPDDVAPTVALGIVFLPASMILITTGARYVPSPEAALILLLETVLSPILAAVAVDEPLTGWTLAGGVVVVATLAAHTVAGRAAIRRRTVPIH